MAQRRPRILFAGGGTGGHLFPAIAIADEIKKGSPDADIRFVGTRGKIEARVVPMRGYGFSTIWISGFRRSMKVENFLFPLKLAVSLLQSLMLLRRLKPDVVVGTGGYVCGPVVFVASCLGIPTLIQEQNSYPGVTTRLLAARATQVHMTFQSSLRYLKRIDNVRVTGNPTRATVGAITRTEASAYFGVDQSIKTILVFGGSLGASSINTAMLEIARGLVADRIQIVWQTGESDFERIRNAIGTGIPGELIKIHKFIERMEYAYGVCDLAVCRAGATTVAELTRAGVPAILVPYPYAAADHQTANARSLVEGGAAVMIPDALLKNRLGNTLKELLHNPDRLREMSGRSLALAVPNAAATLARATLELVKVHNDRTGEELPV